MSFDPDTTRIVRTWLDEGVTELPDRVLDAVIDQLPATQQRRATWWPARRLSTMNTTLKLGVAAAVVAVAALVGINYFGTANVGGPGLDTSTPTSTAVPEATATATAEPTSTPAPQGLPEGAHVLWARSSGNSNVSMTVTIPAAGWFGTPGGGILTKNDTADPPDGAGTIVWGGIEEIYVYGDPCSWSTTAPDAPATTVDEAIAALAAQASRDASEPSDITLDGYAGKAITLHVPDDVNFADCDSNLFSMFSDRAGTRPDAVGRYAQGPGQVDEVWILDVDGRMVVMDWAYYEGTPQAHVDELRAIIESTTFD